MTRLLQAMAGARHGGAEAFFARLAPALARAGVEQRLVTRRHPTRSAALAAAGLPVRETRFGGWLDFPTRWVLAREIRRFRPDVVLTWMNRATDACPTPGAASRFVFAARLGGYYAARHYRRCDHLVANTEDIRRWLIAEGFAADRVHYVPNFVDAAPAEALDRAALGTPADAPLLLCLGRLHPNKAFDVAIAAMPLVPGAWLWIAGEGPEAAALKQRAATLGVADRVRFLGWRTDAARLIATADIVLCPSRHEPLGNVVLEAWACHRPLIAAASAGPAALVTEGRDGLLVPIDDATALAAAIRRVVGSPDLAAALVARGANRVAREFSEAAVVGRYQEFFDRVTG